MTVTELHELLAKTIDNGHGDLHVHDDRLNPIAHVVRDHDGDGYFICLEAGVEDDQP